MKMAYKTERELFYKAFKSSFIQDLLGQGSAASVYIEEPKGLFGIPDLVIGLPESHDSENRILDTFAFEMKIRNWKRALVQAFKYKAFAKNAYVIMDFDFINPALKNIERFEKSNIGLVSIDENGVVIPHFKPENEIPYCPHLTEKFENMVQPEI